MNPLTLIAAVVLCASAAAQQSAPPAAATTNAGSAPRHYYRLNYVLRELDGGKVLNQRSFTNTAVSDGQMWKLRSGSRLPVARNNDINYIDVGVNIDNRLQESDDGLAIEVNADISSAAESATAGAPPILRQARANCEAVVPIGKPSLLFSMDDPASKHRFELEVTAQREK